MQASALRASQSSSKLRRGYPGEDLPRFRFAFEVIP